MADLVHVDRAVARRILGGDQAAFQDLFDRFFPRLYRFALARLGGDAETAREVVQQTFCNAIEHLDRYRGEAALYTWFCQICRNVVADHFRRRGQGAARLALVEDQPNVRAILEALTAPASDEPETGAWQAQVRRIVEATLDALPGRHAEVLEWKYVDGLSVREIAVRLNVGDKAAESLLTRARDSFREAIGQFAGAAEDLTSPMGPQPG
ncbi:MAG TPA: sigma-70 family RNA polymerase sigma factor [Steroidobacteraceae bacterium]|nr:sigma-70 family RNA polymerase sigma factor [Steroidobacteraceae bacterium]